VIVAGVLGLVPAALLPAPADAPPVKVTLLYGYLLGLFPVNVVHSAVHLVIGQAGIDGSLGQDEQCVGCVHLVPDGAKEIHAGNSPVPHFGQLAGDLRQALHGESTLPRVIGVQPIQRVVQRGHGQLRLDPHGAHPDRPGSESSAEVVKAGGEALGSTGQVEGGPRIRWLPDGARGGESGNRSGRGRRFTELQCPLDPGPCLSSLPGDVPEPL